MNDDKTKNIDQLNSFLRGELSAVETYSQCMDEVKDATVVAQLRGLRDSHQIRARMLRERVLAMGGEPAESSGVWGSFAKLVAGGAKLLGPKAAISALEEGEDHGRDDYLRDMSELSADNRFFVEQQILPEQKRTHAALTRIQDVV